MKKHITDFCKRHGLSVEQFSGSETVGGDLYLSSLTSIPEGFNPTVGGSLDLRSLTSIPEGFNPTVGGSLFLKNGSKRIGAAVSVPRMKQAPLQWQGGKYMSVDGVFTEVVEWRMNVCRVRHIGKKELEYLVTDGNGAWAHGATLDDARADLLYKLSERSTEDLKAMGLDDEMEFAQAVAVYRTVTGACAAGCKAFVGQRGIDTAKRYTVKEMLALTDGAYGHDDLKRFADGLKS